MDKAKFFGRIRGSLYGGRLKQVTVDNINEILGYWERNYPGSVPTQLAYILATVLAEVGRNMNPVRETFATSDAQARYRLRHKPYAQPRPPYGHAYYGRGYVQLTWDYNYEKQAHKTNQPLVQFPDLVLSTPIALEVLVEGMMAGDYNGHGHGLPYYINDTKTDFYNARRTVNVLDRAGEIARYAEKYYDAIEFASETRGLSSLLSANDAQAFEDLLILPSQEHMQAQQRYFANSDSIDEEDELGVASFDE